MQATGLSWRINNLIKLQQQIKVRPRAKPSGPYSDLARDPLIYNIYNMTDRIQKCEIEEI